MKTTTRIALLLIGFGLSACEWAEDEPIPPIVEKTYDFGEGTEGWTWDFADLPEDGQEIYELEGGLSPLPEETGATSNSIRLQGHNRSDDLFMFLKKQLTGLSPSTAYLVTFDIELASQYPQDAPGIGGSPGGSVYLKAGANAKEPLPIVEDEGGVRYLRMNIDKGNQSQEGADMMSIGTIGIEGEEYRYELIRRGNNDRPFGAVTDAEGKLWLIVGTDSGFEGLTEVYYKSIKVRLEQTTLLY